MHAPGEGTRPTAPWLGLNEPVLSPLVAPKDPKKAECQVSVGKRGRLSPKGATQESPGHRPVDARPSRARALKGRHRITAGSGGEASVGSALFISA
jgi:hypothetical protein